MQTTVEPTATVEPRPAPEGPASAPGPDATVETVIEPRSGWQLIDLRELWRYRELLVILTWRDIKVRYKQTVLGAAWAVLQPLATMVVFSVFFGRLAGLSSDGVAYPLFVFSGLLPWFFFQSAVTSASQSVVGNHGLVTKVYFPRLIIPLSSTGAALVDFAISFGLLLGMMVVYGMWPGWEMLLAPVVFGLLVVAAIGVGTLLSALTVAYRDFRHAVPFAIQLWMFATPAIYLPNLDSLGGKWWLSLNPAHGLIAAFRAAVLGGPIDWVGLGVSAAVAVGLMVLGAAYFRRVERGFADVI